MTTPRRITLEQGLFSLAFILALVVRFISLGTQPLTDREAKWALQALEIARGSKPLLGSQPAYLLLTAINFFIFGASNFMARFWPALAGAGLVLVPAAFQKHLGRKAAIFLAFALALDPGMLALSRMAGSQMMAVGFIALSLAAWQSRSYRLAGVMGGVALLCGPSAWFGALGLGFTWLILNYSGGRTRVDNTIQDDEGPGIVIPPLPFPVENPRKTAIKWGAGTLLLVGTLFLLVPNGLSAWAGSIVDFMRGWWTPGSVPLWIFLVVLLVYAPLALIFGLIGLARGLRKTDRTSIQLGLLSGTFFLLALIYPVHQAGDLVWMLVPVWSLAAIELSRYLDFGSARKWQIALVAGVTFAFMVFIWLDLISIPSAFTDPGILQSRMMLLLGALLLMILSMFLAAAVWEERIAQWGIVYGGAFALLLYTVSAGLNAAGLRQPFSSELWQPAPQFVQADLLIKTVDELSDWSKGHIQSLDITISSDLNSPALLWLLRNWQVEQVDALALDASPDLVILPQDVEIRLASAYRGQDFILRKTPVWYGLPLDGWLRWIVFRKIPEQSEFLVLWAQDDLFLDAGAGLDTSTP
ncbi:MAG: hypothetical protein A2X25_14170 [Chloroflexi bacterium GWB2_49_20]|nr:MAG: hypothetical protein A2X25_14170 [Chloroflexi bacterium GWB2_49_20]OGN79881.1 MAG: hypothetical protein A2X26_02580 [Chloroflexi bacterium GWC2_49_37]OGN85584.1 MAG: hypothetical protein A2X27_04480 [Chloroflexi bacterium GWD2_49_16]HBG74462.1 hypothetical protein [Anaerolineae bacterium]HCC79665.1 hypothetical protein [Anaerolineae bacterium]